MQIRRSLLILFLLVASPAGLHAHQLSAPAPDRGTELTVYLLTMGPGTAVWERFGHNAIWVRDDLRGTDVAYNYGMFSFEQENFVLRFVRGQMDYWTEGFDAGMTVNAYIQADRSVWVQELNLSPAQRADLRDFLEWNALPENRVYRYDYYLDNCSTRVRDAIDRVLGGQIRHQTENVPTGTTYRDHTRRLTHDDALTYTGLMLGLGQPVDREISAWEEMFLPLQLRERIRDMTIQDETGARVPLVNEEIEVYRSSQPIESSDPPYRTGLYLLVGLLLGGAIWGGSHFARRSRAGGMAFGVAAAGWAAVAGILGLVLLGLWTLTDHQAAYRNENLLFFSPLLLPLAVLLPLAAAGVRRPGVSRAAIGIAGTVAALSVVALLLQIAPIFRQVNGELLALALPANLGLLLAALELGGVRPWRRSPSPVSRGAV